MKKIIISGQEFMYEVRWQITEYSDYEWTEFFKEFDVVYKKRFIFFGKQIKKESPKVLFTVNFNIEDSSLTKSEVRAKLERKVELLGRKEEIKKGEII